MEECILDGNVKHVIDTSTMLEQVKGFDEPVKTVKDGKSNLNTCYFVTNFVCAFR